MSNTMIDYHDPAAFELPIPIERLFNSGEMYSFDAPGWWVWETAVRELYSKGWQTEEIVAFLPSKWAGWTAEITNELAGAHIKALGVRLADYAHGHYHTQVREALAVPEPPPASEETWPAVEVPDEWSSSDDP